jgi:hypothetical protein
MGSPILEFCVLFSPGFLICLQTEKIPPKREGRSTFHICGIAKFDEIAKPQSSKGGQIFDDRFIFGLKTTKSTTENYCIRIFG